MQLYLTILLLIGVVLEWNKLVKFTRAMKSK